MSETDNKEQESAKPMRIKWSALTHPGRFRKNNEDSFLALALDGREVTYLGKWGEATLAEKDFVFAVSDGMGGANAGEFASKIAVNRITQLMPRSFRSAAMGMSVGFSDVLEQLFGEIHEELVTLGRSYEECQGMGATLSLCWIRPEWLYFAHIGDSRIYHLPAAGGLKQVSEDHTHVGWLRRQGKLNEMQARMHPQRNILQQALGGRIQFVNPQVGAIGYEPGDRFLICSDGLIDGHFDRALNDQLREGPPPGADVGTPAQRLVEKAVRNDGRDNVTAIVLEVIES
jgi:PPM family protein phosphatase